MKGSIGAPRRVTALLSSSRPSWDASSDGKLSLKTHPPLGPPSGQGSNDVLNRSPQRNKNRNKAPLLSTAPGILALKMLCACPSLTRLYLVVNLRIRVNRTDVPPSPDGVGRHGLDGSRQESDCCPSPPL